MEWIITAVIASIIGIAFVAVIIKLIIDKKKGKPSCSCGCSGCAMKDQCHKK